MRFLSTFYEIAVYILHGSTPEMIRMRLERTRDKLVELLALDLRNLELERRGLAATVAAGHRTSAPWASTVNLSEAGRLRKRVRVSKRNIYDAMVSKGREGRNGRSYIT